MSEENMKPMLFNTDMVRALLDNRKTVTRRVVKFPVGWNPKWTGYVPDDSVLYGSNNIPAVKSPYHIGDILYVRETWAEVSSMPLKYAYKANNDYLVPKWQSPYYMPREAARIFLRVTGVRVEPLQWCGNMEAKEEGCTCCSQFIRIWDSTIKKTDRALYGWDANPWVWVIEFERISKEET